MLYLGLLTYYISWI